MSHRNRDAKKLNRLRKSLRQSLPTYIDLVDYVQVRTKLSTGRCKQLILDGRVRSESHKLGVLEVGRHKLLNRYVPAKLRNTIEIKKAQ